MVVSNLQLVNPVLRVPELGRVCVWHVGKNVHIPL